MNKNGIIIGVGDGAEQSHYTRKPFWDVKLTKKVSTGNTCNRCGKPIHKGQRYCNNCKKINRRKSQRRWRNKNARH